MCSMTREECVESKKTHVEAILAHPVFWPLTPNRTERIRYDLNTRWLIAIAIERAAPLPWRHRR